jgi:hypothetical protein
VCLRKDRHPRALIARLSRTAIAALVSVSLLACANSSAPPKSRSVLAGNAAQNVLILPLNVTSILSPELEALKDPVWADLETYLRTGNRRLRTASHRDARKLWIDSIQRARADAKGAKVGFDEAARLLVFELSKHAEFDTLVIASLFLREAAISGRAATWDGVDRELEFERNGSSGGKLFVDQKYVGLAPAASLHAVVLDADGRELQDGVGGLELLARVRAKRFLGPGERVEIEFAPYNGPFTNTENIREGITQALAPFFPPPLPSVTE